jgi:hypothetical protein
MTASYYFQGQADTARLQSVLRGPAALAYQVHDELALDAQVWSPCDAQRALNINASVAVSATGSARGIMTVDEESGSIEQRYALRWRRCGLPPPPPPPPPCGELKAGAELHAGDSITSCDGRFELVLQADGNLVEYGPDGAIWSTLTGPLVSPASPKVGYGGLGDKAVMQEDGNFVLYKDDVAVWYSSTAGFGGARLLLQDDSNLVVYGRDGGALWSWLTGNLLGAH